MNKEIGAIENVEEKAAFNEQEIYIVILPILMWQQNTVISMRLLNQEIQGTNYSCT